MSLGEMSDSVVLVHGGLHGAWCFSPLVPLLAARGIKAVAIDLPGHGENNSFPESYYAQPFDIEQFSMERSPIADVCLEDYVAAVDQAVDVLIAEGYERVNLMGHSMGGIPLTPVAERRPNLVSKLIYVAAQMSVGGRSCEDYLSMSESTAGPQGTFVGDSRNIGAIRVNTASDDPSTRDIIQNTFYNDLPDALAYSAMERLSCDIPLEPLSRSVTTTTGGWGSVARVYVSPEDDRALSPALQRRMVAIADALFPDNRTNFISIPGGHSPFIGDPGRFAELIAKVIQS